MRAISLIIIHCSAVRPWRQSGVAEIDRWHRQRGFKYGCGYHFVVRRDGTVETGRPLELVGAHCQFHNYHSLGVCYEGGLDDAGYYADTRTPQQKQSLRQLLERLHAQFPNAMIVGHNVLHISQASPCFNALAEYADLQPTS